MPLVKVEMMKGKGTGYKKKVLDAIHRALVDSFKIPEDNRNQRIYELDAENFEYSPGKTQDFMIIELTVIKGRSDEAKKSLYKAIVDNLEKVVGIRRSDVLIVLNELPMENWGVRGGIPASEANLGINTNI